MATRFMEQALRALGNNPTNAASLSELEKNLQQIVPFVGAGLSADFGYPAWGQFLQKTADDFGIGTTIAELLQQYKYEEAAEELARSRPNRFDDEIRSTFDQAKISRPLGKGAVYYIARIARGPVLTTNFDRALEVAFAEAGRQLEAFPGSRIKQASRALQLKQSVLLKLHGDYLDSSTRVLTLGEYAREYGSAKPERISFKRQLPKVLRQALGAGPFLFLGCSLKRDRTTLVLKEIGRELPGVVHFALLSDVENTPDRNAELDSWTIRPLFFTDGQFDRIEQFLACIADFVQAFPDSKRPQVILEHSNGAESTEPYIVGRDEEVGRLKRMIEATRSPSILNFYGPAGIGKTTLCDKLSGWCKSQQIPSATVDLHSLLPNVTTPAITCKLRDTLLGDYNLHAGGWGFQEVQSFREFNHHVEEHDKVKSAIPANGDMAIFFDKFGFLKKRYRLSLTHGVFARREVLQKYLREVDGTLAELFVQGITALAHSRPLVLFVDTWERLDYSPDVEEWLSTKLLPNLPSGATAVLCGRSEVQKFANRLDIEAHELKALSEADAKAYLRHRGLQDQKVLDAVFELTKGYPLCLALACELSQKGRGWDAVSRVSVAPEVIAEVLLKRLLDEEGVGEVREFLEKGIVAAWFDRGSISYILGISEAKAKKIYERIRRYSFVRPHPYGLQFHEEIRDILRRRLETQNKKEYARLTEKWADYFRKRQEGRL